MDSERDRATQEEEEEEGLFKAEEESADSDCSHSDCSLHSHSGNPRLATTLIDKLISLIDKLITRLPTCTLSLPPLLVALCCDVDQR